MAVLNDMFTEMVERLAKADTSKLTRGEAEAYEHFLRNAGVSADVIKGGSDVIKKQDDVLSNKTLTNQTKKVDNYVSSIKGNAAAKAGVTVIKFVIKNADNLPMMMNLFESLLKNFPDLVADLSKNEMFTEMVERLAKADTSKLTRSEAEVYEKFLRNIGVSEDIIKGSTSTLAKYGDDFGKMVNNIVENGKVLSQNDGNKFVYITQEGVAIVSKGG